MTEHAQARTERVDFRATSDPALHETADRGEQRVAAELGPMMRAVPDEDMRVFLCTQIADEARHVAFFDRFYAEVGVLESDTLEARLEETSAHLNREFGELFDEMLRSRVDRLAAEPEDLETL